MSQLGPGCVKTCTRRERAELFSPFSSSEGDWQIASFLIQRNRDKLSTRKFDVGVFTQPGSKTELSPLALHVRSTSWLRENSEIELANRNFLSTSINLKNKSAGDGCRDKTIEKTIPRTLRARTFSRSLPQEQTSSGRSGVSVSCQ
jgi:hypothetical protein